MPLTRSFRETVAERAKASPGFRAALIEEIMQALADGDMETARLPQRTNACAAPHHVPSAAGTARHAAPFRCRQMIASIVRRRSSCGVLPQRRTTSISGSNTAHCAPVRTRPPSLLAIHPTWDRQPRANRP